MIHNQSGFRNFYTSAALYCVDYLTTKLSSNAHQLQLLYIWIILRFSTLSHSTCILLEKFRFCGVDEMAYNWIKII